MNCNHIFFCAAQNTPNFMVQNVRGAGGSRREQEEEEEEEMVCHTTCKDLTVSVVG